MAAIALTIIILLNFLAFCYAYGAFEGSVGTKKRRFFSRQKSRRALSRSQPMAAIALTIIILLNYLAFYYA